MSREPSHSLETIFHTDKAILELRFRGNLSRDAIAEVFEIFRDPRFTNQHQMMVDLSGVSLDFTVEDISLVASAVEQSPALRPRGARTAWIIDSYTNAEIVRLGRVFAPRWQTVWKFLNDRASALAWLESEDEGDVDFKAGDFTF